MHHMIRDTQGDGKGNSGKGNLLSFEITLAFPIHFVGNALAVHTEHRASEKDQRCDECDNGKIAGDKGGSYEATRCQHEQGCRQQSEHGTLEASLEDIDIGTIHFCISFPKRFNASIT